jgi:hypothetical protein
MGLGGRLSDLSLVELLQVVAFSRKSGVLEITGEHGNGIALGLRDGWIVRVARDDGSLDPEQVLEKRGVEAGAAAERRDAVLSEVALDVLLDLFDWRDGAFTFEPGPDPATHWRGPAGVLLASPISPEYLALEGARLADESSLPTLRPKSSGPTASPARPAAPETAPAPQPPRRAMPVICVDRDLRLLEQIKRSLCSSGEPIHIFQDSASALNRLKQYVLRGELPALVLGSDLEDPLDPRRGLGWRRFAERVRALAPRVRIAVIADQAGDSTGGIAWLRRPPEGRATEADMSAFLQTLRGAIQPDPQARAPEQSG